jgi:hypothetical protein
MVKIRIDASEIFGKIEHPRVKSLKNEAAALKRMIESESASLAT